MTPTVPTHITTATTTVVKSGAGVLRGICVNTTAASIITVYDNTSASSPVIAILKASIAEGEYLKDIKFQTGLTIVTAGSPDLTVKYE